MKKQWSFECKHLHCAKLSKWKNKTSKWNLPCIIGALLTSAKSEFKTIWFRRRSCLILIVSRFRRCSLWVTLRACRNCKLRRMHHSKWRRRRAGNLTCKLTILVSYWNKKRRCVAFITTRRNQISPHKYSSRRKMTVTCYPWQNHSKPGSNRLTNPPTAPARVTFATSLSSRNLGVSRSSVSIRIHCTLDRISRLAAKRTIITRRRRIQQRRRKIW